MNEIVIYGVIGSWSVDPEDIIHQLKYMDGDVLVLVDSVGGSIIAGISIHNAFKSYDKGKVIMRITGVAASITSYIVLAGDEIEAYDNTTYMIHNAWLPVSGDHHALRKSADLVEGLSSVIANGYISKTGMSAKTVTKLMDEETFYFGVEMKDAGFVDTIITAENEVTKAEARSLTVEKLKACNNAVREHESDLSFEAVAKMLPGQEEHKISEVVDLSAQQKRARSLDILEKELSL